MTDLCAGSWETALSGKSADSLGSVRENSTAKHHVDRCLPYGGRDWASDLEVCSELTHKWNPVIKSCHRVQLNRRVFSAPFGFITGMSHSKLRGRSTVRSVKQVGSVFLNKALCNCLGIYQNRGYLILQTDTKAPQWVA